jgi:hypothetical protein
MASGTVKKQAAHFIFTIPYAAAANYYQVIAKPQFQRPASELTRDPNEGQRGFRNYPGLFF